MASLAKITAPAPAGLVPRARVFRKLDECLAKPAAWVSGPAGSGKTALVSSYLADRQLPHLWYHLDAGDTDASAFFYYLGLAARQAAPRFRKPLPLLTPEYLLGIPVFTKRYFEELYRRLRPPFVFVLDDYQELAAESQLHQIIAIGLSSLPAGIKAIVLGRSTPPPALARLRANAGLALLGYDQVRLTRQETREIANHKGGRKLSATALSLLHRQTEGWVAGLVLLLEEYQLQRNGRQLPEALATREVFDYFANEIFQKMAPETQGLLLKTSFLPLMTADMAQALTGVETAGAILDNLTASHYFTEKRPQKEQPAYLYHPLFREFLLAKAREAFPAGERAEIQRQAAALLIAAGQEEEAVGLLCRAGEWKALLPLLIDQAPRLMSQGRSRTLMQWIGQIPDEIVQGSAWVLYWKGIGLLPREPAAGRGYLEQAFQLFDRQGRENANGAFLAWSGAVQSYLFELHDLTHLDRWIDWLDTRMAETAWSFPPETGAETAAGMVGALAWRRPHHPRMAHWVATALSLARETTNLDTALRAYTNSAFYYLWMGEFGECGLLLQQMRKLVQSRFASPARLITLKAAEAMFANSLADQEEQAIRMVQEGLEIAEKTGVHVFDPVLSIQGMYSSLNRQDLGSVEAYLARMEIYRGDRYLNTGYFFYFSAWHALLAGDLTGAAVAARKSLQLIESAGVPISVALIRLTLAQIAHEARDREEADRQLHSAGKITRQTKSPYLRYVCDLLEALFSFDRQNDEAGLQALRRGLALGRTQGFFTLIHFWRPAAMTVLCLKALEADIEAAHARSLIQKLRLVPEVPPVEVEAWPWPVRIYTLGRFALLINGEPVKDSLKAPKKPLLLLKALIALGGRGIKVEVLADLLWPDADGDAGHNAFTTTLARLRSLLGDPRAVLLHDGRLTLVNHICWVDRWAFERLCSRTEALLEKSSAAAAGQEELRGVMEKAARLYGGHFLGSDADEVWTFAGRELLRNKYLRLVSAMGDFFRSRREYREAARHYQKGLEADPFAEAFYQGLMDAYFQLGRHAEALQTYRQCRQVLETELGIAPSPKTEALKERLRKDS